MLISTEDIFNGVSKNSGALKTGILLEKNIFKIDPVTDTEIKVAHPQNFRMSEHFCSFKFFAL